VLSLQTVAESFRCCICVVKAGAHLDNRGIHTVQVSEVGSSPRAIATGNFIENEQDNEATRRHKTTRQQGSTRASLKNLDRIFGIHKA